MSAHSPLWERIDEQGVRDVSIVGISKHAGKTTVLGRLIADAGAEGRSLGVASIGLDGERADSLIGVPKPAILVPEGTLFATAIRVHRHDHAPVRWLEPASISSPLGEVWIGQTLAEGTIELAGVRQLAHLLALRKRFRQLGADHVLFDGALARMIAVSPQVADGVILASGAAVGGVAQVVRETVDAVRRLTVPLATSDVVAWANELHDPYGLFEKIGAEGQARVVYDGGAITDASIGKWLGVAAPLLLIGRDPTCLFVSREVWRAFLRAGHQLQVLARSPLLGVAINPVSPFGEILDRRMLLDTMKSKLTVPVWDVMDQETADAMDG